MLLVLNSSGFGQSDHGLGLRAGFHKDFSVYTSTAAPPDTADYHYDYSNYVSSHPKHIYARQTKSGSSSEEDYGTQSLHEAGAQSTIAKNKSGESPSRVSCSCPIQFKAFILPIRVSL